MKLYAGYRRVSHTGGRKKKTNFHSPDDQAEEIEAWARETGRGVEMLEAELDAKGDNPDRPILREAIDGVRSGRYAGIVSAYLSRSGRDLRLMLDLWGEIEDAGGEVHFARERIDGSTPSGRLQRNLLASIAQHELEERREGFDRARRGAVEAGIWQRRQTPRGYSCKLRKHGGDGKLHPDEQADEVREAARDLLTGTPVLELAERLGMTPNGVRAMLRNSVYLGEQRVGQYVNKSAHEPILDGETFEAVQRKLANAPRPSRNGTGPALLAGLVRCSSCGHVMTRSDSRGHATYTCPTHHSGQRCPAPASVFASRLDGHVEPIALAELARLRVTAADGDRVAHAQEALDCAERELEAYTTAISAADVGAEAFAAGARQRRDAVDAARDELQTELARRPGLPDSLSGSEAWAKLNVAERNELLRALLAAVVVRPAGRGRKLPMTDRCRVVAHGAELGLPPRGGGAAAGIVPLDFEDLDVDHVLGVPAGKDQA